MDLVLQICGLIVLILFVVSFYVNPIHDCSCGRVHKCADHEDDWEAFAQCPKCNTLMEIHGMYVATHSDVVCPSCGTVIKMDKDETNE